MPESTCPAPRSRVIELYFMEHRAKLIDIAAFLDRLDRAEDDLGGEDFRVEAFRRAAAILNDGKPQRSKRVLELFSDHSAEPIGQTGWLGQSRRRWPKPRAHPPQSARGFV